MFFALSGVRLGLIWFLGWFVWDACLAARLVILGLLGQNPSADAACLGLHCSFRLAWFWWLPVWFGVVAYLEACLII